MDTATKEHIGKAWSINRGRERNRWWCSPRILKHINGLICGEELDGWNTGPLQLVKKEFPEKFETALSIGSGSAAKEVALVEKQIVAHFDIYELSPKRIEVAKKKVQEKGLEKHFTFYNDDYFSNIPNKKFDLIFFDNALHHMLDVDFAVRTTYDNLNKGGCFFCHDFVGASRFQWSDLELSIVNGIRCQLHQALFKVGKRTIPRLVHRPSLEAMIAADPSEAADSDAILPAIQKYIDNPLVIHTGGLIYHLCCNDILVNIPEESALLTQLLSFDKQTIEHGFKHYAFIMGKK